MSERIWLFSLLVAFAWAAPARAQREIVVLGQPITPVDPPMFVPAPPIPLEIPEAPIEEPPWLRTEFGVRTWLSTGHSTLSVAGPMGAPGVLSYLQWTRINNPIIELFADTAWRDRWLLAVEFGIGTSGGGRLRDLDFDNDQFVTSDTGHPVRNNELFYANIDFGYRFVSVDCGAARRPGRFTLDGLIGYQHWQERYLANDGVDHFPGTRVFAPGRTGSNRFAWDSLRLGARARFEYPRWSLEGRIYAIPCTAFEDIDIHYRREDVLHDPSFIDRASGGSGAMGDVTLRYRLLHHLQLEAGYRWWSLVSGRGYSIVRTPDGNFSTPFNRAHTLRHGLTLGLSWQF